MKIRKNKLFKKICENLFNLFNLWQKNNHKLVILRHEESHNKRVRNEILPSSEGQFRAEKFVQIGEICGKL